MATWQCGGCGTINDVATAACMTCGATRLDGGGAGTAWSTAPQVPVVSTGRPPGGAPVPPAAPPPGSFEGRSAPVAGQQAPFAPVGAAPPPVGRVAPGALGAAPGGPEGPGRSRVPLFAALAGVVVLAVVVGVVVALAAGRGSKEDASGRSPSAPALDTGSEGDASGSGTDDAGSSGGASDGTPDPIDPTTSTREVTTTTGGASTPGAIVEPAGSYVLVLESVPYGDGIATANSLLSDLRGQGYDVQLLDTADHPLMTPGYWAVVLGPYPSEAEARSGHCGEVGRTNGPRCYPRPTR